MSDNAYTYFDGFDSVDVPADGILSRTILDNESIRFVLFYFAAGQELSEHTAAFPGVIQILSGQARLGLGEDSKAAHAGSIAYMTPGLRHSVFAETPVIMLLQLLKSPRAKEG